MKFLKRAANIGAAILNAIAAIGLVLVFHQGVPLWQ